MCIFFCNTHIFGMLKGVMKKSTSEMFFPHEIEWFHNISWKLNGNQCCEVIVLIVCVPYWIICSFIDQQFALPLRKWPKEFLLNFFLE